MKPEVLSKVAQSLNLAGDEDLLAAIGYGHVAVGTVVNKLKAEGPPTDAIIISGRSQATSGPAVTLEGGIEGVAIKRAKCCAPVPGDVVIGYISRGKGMVLHREDCPNMVAYKQNEPDRLVNVQWSQPDGERYDVDIRIEALDRVGLLNDISSIFSSANTNITAASSKSLPDKKALMVLTADVRDLTHLNALLVSIGRLSDILKIERVSTHSSPKEKQE